ncbi:MAG: FtsX-like permease family protein [Candidatus Promineifilaceae bacterium]
MSFLYRIQALFTLTFKRLLAQRGLTVATLLGLVTAVALIMTVPLYSDAVYFHILEEELSHNADRTNRPPFAYMYDYVGSWAGPVQWEDIQPLDQYLTNQGARDLGLPQEILVRHIESSRIRLFPSDETNYNDSRLAFGVFQFANTTRIEDYIDVFEGSFPDPADPSPDSTIDVLVSENMATESGVQVGENLIAYDFQEETTNPHQTAVRVAGIWRAKDENDDFWFFTPMVFDDLLLVPEETFVERISPVFDNEVERGVWYLVLDGSGINTSNANALASRAARVERRTDSLLPKIRAALSPADALSRYRDTAERLTILLAAFNVPTIGLILAFIGLVVGLGVNQRRNEIAVIRSRGGTPWQIVGFALLEGLVLGALASLIGTGVALGLTQLMGKSRSFLDFSAASDLRVALTPNAWQAALVAILLAILAQVLPTIAASQDTIITYKQEQARSLKRPLWQRLWLDVLLLIPAVYGMYLLREQGTITDIGDASSGSAFQNPLFFLIPALVVFSLTLLFLRVLPLIVGAVSWLLAQTNSIGLLMASRQLSRMPRIYAMPLILLVLTVSLAVFTASLARTLDLQLYDESRYNVGADINLRGAGVEFGVSSIFPGQETGEERTRAIYLPLSEYETFPGIEAATRVGRFSGQAQVGDQRINGTYLGIDRADFGEVAFWRWDFAPYRLGSLLNALAVSPDAILVSNDFARQRGLRPGDLFRLTVSLSEGQVELDSQIVGTFDYFPTWYPEEDGPLFVGNLDNLFSQVGGQQPYEVWLSSQGQVDKASLDQALDDRKLFGWTWKEPYFQVTEEQRQPERQGVFGLLSVGFIAAALLTVLGFFMYALFSLRQRFISLGILRAIGLTQWHMTIFIAFELAFLILTGLTLGTVLGTFISRQFIPYLQIGVREVELVPPYLVEIAWSAVSEIYLLFGLMFIVALGFLASILRRMRIFQAIKLGETV